MRLVFFLAALVLFSGCATTRAVPPSAYADMQARLDGERVTVVLADGTAWTAHALRLGPDSTSWFDAAGGAMRSVPTASIVEIEHEDVWKQMKQAVGRGVVASVVSGLAFNFLLSQGTGLRPDPVPEVSDVLGMAAFGAGAGVVVGLLVRVPDRYVLAPPDSLAVGVPPR